MILISSYQMASCQTSSKNSVFQKVARLRNLNRVSKNGRYNCHSSFWTLILIYIGGMGVIKNKETLKNWRKNMICSKLTVKHSFHTFSINNDWNDTKKNVFCWFLFSFSLFNAPSFRKSLSSNGHYHEQLMN